MRSLRTIIFIDGTWLWHNNMNVKDNFDIDIDLEVLPQLLSEIVANKFSINMMLTRIIFCTSIPTNVHPSDESALSRRHFFFDKLQQFGYDLELYPIDFQGRHLFKRDRDEFDIWQPKEKCVDIALASNILFYVNDYDIALIITGDKDFLPVITKIHSLGKFVELASYANSCSNQLIDFLAESGNDPIWIDDYLDNLAKLR